MVKANTLVQIFCIGFGLNVIWEFSHCMLYETCRRQTWQQNIPLLTIMSLKDGFFIVLFYTVSVLLFNTTDIVHNPKQLIFFAMVSLCFSFFDERVSLRRGRWEYAAVMPRFFGVGVTPLVEIAATGVATFFLVRILSR